MEVLKRLQRNVSDRTLRYFCKNGIAQLCECYREHSQTPKSYYECERQNDDFIFPRLKDVNNISVNNWNIYCCDFRGSEEDKGGNDT